MQITYRGTTWSFDHPLTVLQMLGLIEVAPETVLVVRNGHVLAENQQLFPGDVVKVVSVISGG